ncbi:MAG: efflux RND transporter periplasmic adaptor subunit [Planctomycetota bacterium]|jgi:cobalt-zinc-cadmium efflux system membrane fusion protein
MWEKIKLIGTRLSALFILIGVILWLTGNLHFGPVQSNVQMDSGHAESSTHTQGVNQSSVHEHGSNADISNLESAVCEHLVRTIDCDNCRYELGVVKIQPSVAKALIQTSVVDDKKLARKLKLTGQIQLDTTRTVDVVPAGSGRVERVVKQLGEEVEEGEALAVIHSADFGQAKAGFLEVQAKLELAQATVNREKELYEKEISSQADYLSALNGFKAAEANFAAAEKRLRLFGLEAKQIVAIKSEKENGNFAELVLCAPRAGTIIKQNISTGKLVENTESLFTVADLSNVWIWCDVYEKDLAILHEQLTEDKTMKAKVHVKAFEGVEFEGTVDLIGSLMDEHTRTVKVRIQAVNPEDKLKPGMFADVEISIPFEEQMTVIPRSAVLNDDGRAFVFQHLKDDLWLRRDVVLGKSQETFVEVIDGLSKGSEIVSGGAFMLKSDILREKMGAGCAD